MQEAKGKKQDARSAGGKRQVKWCAPHPLLSVTPKRVERTCRNRKFEIGSSLVEILVAVGIVALALTVFVAGLSTGAFAVRASNRLTTANNLASSQLETIKAAGYITGTASYPAIPWPSGYSIVNAVTQLQPALQQVTVTVSYQGGSVVVSNYKVNR